MAHDIPDETIVASGLNLYITIMTRYIKMGKCGRNTSSFGDVITYSNRPITRFINPQLTESNHLSQISPPVPQDHRQMTTTHQMSQNMPLTSPHSPMMMQNQWPVSQLSSQMSPSPPPMPQNNQFLANNSGLYKQPIK